MKKKFLGVMVLIATAIAFGTFLVNIVKKAGLEDIFDFDLNEDIDEEAF
jgi:hypothetical protein